MAESPKQFFCTYCKSTLVLGKNCYKNSGRSNGLSSLCILCSAAFSKERNTAIRKQILEHYGGKCICCGDTTFEFLAIDHKNGGGSKHRRSIGCKDGAAFSRWVIKNNYPDFLQLLCHNCNLAKGFYGQCPHERGK